MRVNDKVLIEKITDFLVQHKVNKSEALDTANCMVLADLYGVKTHGTVVLPSHFKRISNGGYNLNPSFNVIKETPSFAIIDADNSIGFASASYCMRYAIEKCSSTGIYTVFSRNANAYGAAFCYAMQAAEKGLIGFTCCNSPAAMAPIGGKERRFGTNPLSMVIPIGEGISPIIIDMATSKVAKSRFLQCKRDGLHLGEGWALNAEGKPTTDPDEGIQGLVCPMEGFKGYGLALMIDFIAGFLSGAAWQNHVNKFYNESGEPMNVGHLFVAIDPIQIFGEDYWREIKDYVLSIRNSLPAGDGGKVAIPGDDKELALIENSNLGIECSSEVAELLNIKL